MAVSAHPFELFSRTIVLGYINIEKPIDADKDEVSFKNNTIIYKYELDNDGQATTVRDTTEILKFE